MKSKKYAWTLGEIANLSRQERPLKSSGLTSYMHFISSRFICIREESEGSRGIILRVMGKAYADQVKMVGGEPFTRDDHEAAFAGHRYYSYTFPSAKEVQEVIDILRENPLLLMTFEDAKMHINPDGRFWVRETARNKLLQKIPQIYDGIDGQLHKAADDTPYYRIAIAYFYKDTLKW